MAIIEADIKLRKKPATVAMPLVRRLEAVGFRAWPSSTSHYDGAWQIRLTAGHPSKRLNSIVPLDPSDDQNIDARLESAERRFAAFARPLVLRETPLASPALMTALIEQRWECFEETVVMTLDLASQTLPDSLDHLPSYDVGRYVDANLHVERASLELKPGLIDVIAQIEPPVGFFVIEDIRQGPAATTLCVQDNDLAGIMTLAVAPLFRRQGLGSEVLVAALRWARMRGSRTAWLQVTATNAPALSLYERLGFEEAYRYRYWKRPTP